MSRTLLSPVSGDSRLTDHHHAEVFVNEGVFGILDLGEVPVESVDRSGRLIARMSAGALVRTGINTGNVHVETCTGTPASWPGELR
ncbi:hypothetical protein ACFC1D_00680 [Streptomyces vinaceus]|uniref:hypothetical protein n=1 Tax=Streptomyces vinaceus TaxID=1960 RepID=UPI0035D91213